MCGRFTITHPNAALARLFDAVPGNDLPDGPDYNVCPTDTVAVVTSDGTARRLRAMRWGLIPAWAGGPNDGPLLINARADTIATKPAFREAARSCRGIVPASGFYEWETVGGRKLPWYFTRTDGAPMAFAAVWQRWERDGRARDTVAIVSTDAGTGMRGLHHREPVILDPVAWPLWLGEAGHGAAALMVATPPGTLQAHRVGTEVNSNRAAGEGLILPVAA